MSQRIEVVNWWGSGGKLRDETKDTRKSLEFQLKEESQSHTHRFETIWRYMSKKPTNF